MHEKAILIFEMVVTFKENVFKSSVNLKNKLLAFGKGGMSNYYWIAKFQNRKQQSGQQANYFEHENL